jgi:hypothetical protein
MIQLDHSTLLNDKDDRNRSQKKINGIVRRPYIPFLHLYFPTGGVTLQAYIHIDSISANTYQKLHPSSSNRVHMHIDHGQFVPSRSRESNF